MGTPFELDSIELLSCDDSLPPRELISSTFKTFGSPSTGCEFFVSYTMVECCGKITSSILDTPLVRRLSPERQLNLVATSGRPFGPIELRLVDAQGAQIEMLHEPGQVQIRGPTVFERYHGDDIEAREVSTV